MAATTQGIRRQSDTYLPNHDPQTCGTYHDITIRHDALSGAFTDRRMLDICIRNTVFGARCRVVIYAYVMASRSPP